jgi:hypothetical protein
MEHTIAMNAFIEAGADVNAQDKVRSTALRTTRQLQI